MRRVTNRQRLQDPSGFGIEGRGEQLVENANGDLRVEHVETQRRCSGCYRPTPAAQLRGSCDHCRRNSVCVHCASKCAACGRVLCGRCRRSFVGAKVASVCPRCLVNLQRQQAWEIRQMANRRAFERQLLLRREADRRAMLKLRALRMAEASRIAAQRHRLNSQLALMRFRLHALRQLR